MGNIKEVKDKHMQKRIEMDKLTVEQALAGQRQHEFMVAISETTEAKWRKFLDSL